MNKRQNKRKIDMEVNLFMYILHLKEEKNKKYSVEECEKNIVYIFENYNEFKSYFVLNGFVNIDEDILELCRMKTTKKGKIIALKGLCDYAIRKHSSKNLQTMNSSNEEKHFDVLAVPCKRAFVVSPEKSERFKNQKQNLENRRKLEDINDEFKVNNLIKEGPTLKKLKK